MQKLFIASIFFILCSNAYCHKILVLGDSLTEGYGIDSEKAFPAILEEMAKAKGHEDVKVINGGVSGSTTASGLSRLNWFFKAKPEIIIIALGANDGLRGLKVEKSKENLEAIITKSKEKGLKVILGGMKMPRNYGKEYRDQFEKMYKDLYKKHKVIFIPFLLKNVGGVPKLNLADGIHPNEEGHKVVAKNVYEYLGPLL